MKGAQIFAQLAPPSSNKYIPTPQAATIILNFFVYNNFQDFNTWQQLARTKIQYDYFENSRAAHVCKVVLRWEDRTLPTFMESAQAKTKKSAKKRALRRMVESIIHQGYIGLGFKEENFVERLPRRRKDDSDESQQEMSEQRYAQRSVLLCLLKQGQYGQILSMLSGEDMRWKAKEVLQSWRYGLSIKSTQFLRKVILSYRGVAVSFTYTQKVDRFRVSGVNRVLPRQFSYGKQVNDPLREELTDFIRYSQLQKSFRSHHTPLRSPDLTVRPVPSEQFLSEVSEKRERKDLLGNRQEFISLFRPIEAAKIFLSQQRQKREREMTVELPRFEKEEREVPLRVLEEMYGMLAYYCLDYQFVEEVIEMMRDEIKTVQINFDQHVQMNYQERGVDYYLNFKNMLTAEFCHLIHGKLLSSLNNVSIEGMIVPFPHEEQVFVFNSKQPEQIVARKINRRANLNEFDEMQEISVSDIVALVSKIDTSIIYLGQILELSPAIKVYVPQLSDQGSDPEPFTMFRVYNLKIFDKTSSSIIKVAKNCMKLLEQHTHIIWQPPSYPTLSILAQLLIEWQTVKATVLIVSVDFDLLHAQLINLGFKVVKITQRTEQKALNKSSIVVASPAVVCCDLLKNYAYSRVFIESAHHISEISCLSAIVKGCQELYLMGDPLMPRMPVGSAYCHKHGMGVSLIQRLYNGGAKTQTFTSKLQNCRQFRNVMEWADCFLYNRKLLLFENEMQTPVIKGFPWPSLDYRVCFLHHPNIFQNEGEYLEQQAFICSAICGQVTNSGYTKLQEITCSAATQKSLPFLQKYMGVLLRALNYSEAKLFKKYMGILCRVVSGSTYLRSDLSVLMLGTDRQNISFREIVGALREGRRGVIVIGDMDYFGQSQDVANFMDWCREKKLVSRVESPLIRSLF